MNCPRCHEPMFRTHRVEREPMGHYSLIKVVQLNECFNCNAEVVIVMPNLVHEREIE